MIVVCNPIGTIPQMQRPAQGVIDMEKAGFSSAILDVSMGCGKSEFIGMARARREAEACKRPYIPDQPEAIPEMMAPYLAECKKRGLSLPVARAPFLPRDRRSADLNVCYRRMAEESVKLAVREGCEAVIVRPIFVGETFETAWETNRQFYLSLVPLVEGASTKILLENQCKDSEGHLIRGICAEPEEAAEWIDALNQESGGEHFGFCMNTGSYNLCGQDMYECATILGKRVKAVILRDCNGSEEASMIPFTCVSESQFQTDWLSLIRGLREIEYSGLLIFEAEDTICPASQLLRPQLLALLKATADFFVWQIGLEDTIKKYRQIVLFGAGNMCLNYLKNYGEKYPPLFTCDNNRDRWGEDFYGLTIHDPKDLLSLPEGTGIFICNMFYREIEEQLRSMGVTNGIEYFNDEYLPVISMQRLKGL